MSLDTHFTPWMSVMNLPSRGEIDSFRSKQRSPYIVCYPNYEKAVQYTQYYVDFRAEYLPKGTYLCLCNFDLDISSIKPLFRSVYREYKGVAGYAGFQRLADGTTCAIMSIWDTYCKSDDGKVSVLRPKVVYADNLIRSGVFGGEGKGIQCLVRYDWKAGNIYRFFLQIKDEENTGISHLTMWVNDCGQNTWTKLIEYNLQIRNTKLMSSCVFLENFLENYSGEIRSMELSNFCVYSDKGKWVQAKNVQFYQSNDFPGSYNYGVQDTVFWAITTGLPNRCRKPAQWMRLSVR